MQHKASWLNSYIKTYRVYAGNVLILVLICMSSHVGCMELPDADDNLMRAILAKDVEGVRLALMQPVTINLAKKEHSYHTPLSEAVGSSNEHIVQMLLAYPGIEVNTKLEHDWRPLHIAAHHRHAAIIRMLIWHGAQLDVLNDQGMTPLHEAVYQADASSIEVFVSEIPKKNIYTLLARVVVPLLCSFKRFAQADGVAIAVPRDIQLLLCRYALKAHIPDIIKEQLAALKPLLEHKDDLGRTPSLALIFNRAKHTPETHYHIFNLLLIPNDMLRSSVIADQLKKQLNQTNLTSKPHNSGK